jgi:hypothetical protein
MSNKEWQELKLWVRWIGWEGVRTGTKLALLYALISPLLWAYFSEEPFDFSYIPDFSWIIIFVCVSIGGVPPGAVIGGLTGVLIGMVTRFCNLQEHKWQRPAAGIAISAIIVELLHMEFGRPFLEEPYPSRNGYLLFFAIPAMFYLLGTIWFSLKIPAFLEAYSHKRETVVESKN